MCESQKKEDTHAKCRGLLCFFNDSCVGYRSKSQLAKAAGAEPCAHSRCQKWHAAVARSAFSSQHVQDTTCSEPLLKLGCRKMVRRCGAKGIWTGSGHLLKFGCRKIARRCGAKHIYKAKCTEAPAFWSTFRGFESQSCPRNIN